MIICGLLYIHFLAVCFGACLQKIDHALRKKWCHSYAGIIFELSAQSGMNIVLNSKNESCPCLRHESV
jgi:hypothetical protein